MTGHTASHAKNIKKKILKREQRMLARLKAAQQAQARALEHYHRAEERLQKRVSRVHNIEGELTLVRQQLDDLQARSEQSSAEIEMPAWAQYTPPTHGNEETTSDTDEASHLALEAREAAEATEANTRLAATRAAEKDEVAEIEAEEEIVETITAVTIAEIAAERAAAAEAMAEASSARTREARRKAQLSEEALGEVRVAIRNELLQGEEAQHALREVEREVTKAQAELADAEAAEEQALATAMNAEAEAEVAEGMAYAAADRSNLTIEEEQADFHGEPGITSEASHLQSQEME